MKMLRYFSFILGAVSIVMMLASCQSRTTVETIEPIETKQVVDSEDGSPKIVLIKASHDFGDIGPGSTQKADYSFINEGDATLWVKRIQSTCGCSRPVLMKDGKRYDGKAAFDPPIAFEPGESGKVEVTYRAGTSKGTISKKLYILTNDPTTARAQLVLNSRIVVKVAVTPEKIDLYFDQPNAGMPDLGLESVDDVPFSIKWISVANKTITIPFDPAEKATHFTLKPLVDLEKLKQFNRGVIQILTDHPQGGRLMVRYKSRPLYEASMQRYILQNIKPGKPIFRENLIRGNYGNAVEIESITSRNGYMEVENQQQDGNNVNLTIKITPPTQELATNRYMTDELTITLKDGHKVPVRCSGWYKLK